MRGSLKLFTWFKIPVHLHWTFGLIFLYAVWIGYDNNLGPLATFWLMGFFVALFACVLLHEYGHALMARRYDVDTRDIVLTPIGGIARLEKMPEKPIQEFLVAIAGPAVNVVIALVLLAVSYLVFQDEKWEIFKWFFQQQFGIGGTEESEPVLDEDMVQPSGMLFYLPALIATNIGLVVFNLIPAFPMDGGRIFRSLLAMRIGRPRATKIASIVGQVLAVGFMVYGFWQGAFTLALIGLFVFSTARTENNMVQLDELLRRYHAGDIIRRNYTRLYVGDWMQTAADHLRQGLERHFLVFDMQDRLIGALYEDRIIEAIKRNQLSAEVSTFMQKVELIYIEEPLPFVYYLVKQQDKSIIAVAENGTLAGVIDDAGLDNFLRMQQ